MKKKKTPTPRDAVLDPFGNPIRGRNIIEAISEASGEDLPDWYTPLEPVEDKLVPGTPDLDKFFDALEASANAQSEDSRDIVERLFGLLVVAGDSTINLKYNRRYVGLARNGVPDNYVIFRPRKAHVIAEFRMPKSKRVSELLDEHGLELLEYSTRWGRYRVRLTAADVTTHRDVIVHLAQIARSGAEE